MIDQATRPILLLISAPSGGGKTTVCQRMLASSPGLKRVVTCTTRLPRSGERNGVDYWFLDAKTFQERLAAGDFLEHAVVYDHHYGTPRSEVQRLLQAGTDVLIALDVQGANSVRTIARTDTLLSSALVTVFLTPPSIEELAARLQRRGQDAPDVIAKRLEAARREIEHWREFDYLLLSSTIEEDLRRMQAIYLAEKMRVRPSPGAGHRSV
ncbi:MAG: guanylate kinase [Verrucomicrobiota bacterium]|nr:guanylate kinase [Verrucomicrobiota bacterium]